MVLIDFEFASYWYRGLDVGGHFFEKEIIWNDPQNKLSGMRYSDEDKRSFAREYLKEERRLETGCSFQQDDWQPDEVDVDRLLTEADLGLLLKQLFLIAGLLFLPPHFAGKDPSLTHLTKWVHEQFVQGCRESLS